MGSGGATVATSVPARMRNSLLGYWYQARPYQRFGYLVGGVLVLVGLAHLVAWVVVGGAWAGPISFRKPTTFGISFGLTTITLAWVAGHLRISDRIGWLLLGPLAAADTAEVVWVSLQRWRGVASHFNNATPLDNLLFVVMGGGAVAVEAMVILAITVLAFTAMRAASSMALAIRAGLLILLVAQVVGGWMIQHGLGLAEEGVTEGLTTFGAAGIMKVPHAVAIHAIQALPALAWLLSFAALPEPQRLALVRIAVVGYAALVAVSVLQTVTGAAPFDVGVVAAVLYLVAVALLGTAVCGRPQSTLRAEPITGMATSPLDRQLAIQATRCSRQVRRLAAFVRGGPMTGSEVRYVNSGGVHIAYRVFGDGPVDLVLVPAFTSHLEQNHEWPGVVRWNARLVSFSRLIVFDKRRPDSLITRPDRSSLRTPCRTSWRSWTPLGPSAQPSAATSRGPP